MDFIQYFFKIFIIFAIIGLIILIIELIATYKIYKKAGYKGWEALIPFYNNWILIKIAELNEWYYLGLLLPIICSILNAEKLEIISYLIYLTTTIFIYYNLSKKFNKDLFFTILIVLFPYIMIPILGFSKDCIYNSNIKVSKHGPFKDNTPPNSSYNQNTNNINYCTNCRNKTENDANFCKYCGNRINENK